MVIKDKTNVVYGSGKNHYLPPLGNKVLVHAYKHNGLLYKSWENPYFIYEDEEVIVLYNKFIRIYDYRQKPRFSKDDTFWILYKNKWFNVLLTIKENDQIIFYINVSSPFIVEDNAVKYIDYDLDFKISVLNVWKEIDIKEYKFNSTIYNYEPSIKEAVSCSEKFLSDYLRNNKMPFINKTIFLSWFNHSIKPIRSKYINQLSNIELDTTNLKKSIIKFDNNEIKKQ